MIDLDKINSPADLKTLNMKELEALSAQVRRFLVETVANCGGHLASNLGVVELTICLHYIFDSPSDKIIWDVGHQSYVHKMLTGRFSKMHTLRSWQGLSGFPKSAESPHDIFNTGHSGTSVSAALGLARARDLCGGKEHVIAIIGDASFGGMAFEAFNDCGHTDTNLIVILNDNQMSISKNEGSISKYLSVLRSTSFYHNAKQIAEHAISALPFCGKFLAGVLKKIKDLLKQIVLPDTLFEGMGFQYFGPVDGHNITALMRLFERIKKMDGKILIHISTTKGKGYAPAEHHPDMYHGIGKFDPLTGKKIANATVDFSSKFGEILCALAEKNEKIVAMTAAMPLGTGLGEFMRRFPDRFYDVGIAEQHGVTMAAGLAAGGMRPVFAVYSSFLQRGYDQVLHDVCLQSLDVVFAVDRSGIVGEDGETHQGIYGISYLSHMPGLTIFEPSCYEELRRALTYSTTVHRGPVAILYPKGEQWGSPTYKNPYLPAKGEVVREGTAAVIIATGRMVLTALDTANALFLQGIDVAVVDLRCIKPMDEQLILTLGAKYSLLFTVEENVASGGIGCQITSLLHRGGLSCSVFSMALPDKPLPHGSVQKLLNVNGLDMNSIVQRIKKVIGGISGGNEK